MRHQLLLLVTICMLFASCKKERIKGAEDYRVKVGEQELGLYLNGQPWLPDYRDAGNSVEPISVSMYIRRPPGGRIYNYMWIRGRKADSDFDLYLPAPLKPGRVMLNQNTLPYPTILEPPAYGMHQVYSPFKGYLTSSSVGGYVDIIRADTVAASIEGTFEFEAINKSTNEKVKITNGYFRLR